MDCISIDRLTFGYDKKVIFNDLSLSFGQGNFCSILGPNGSGKTTLLKCIVGLLQPSGGMISLYGKPMSEYNMMDLARKIAYVPQYQDIVFDISVFDYVMLGRNPYQTPWEMQRAEDKEIVEEMLQKCNVWHYRDTLLQSLSGGERQRVMIACALACRPKLLIADEPTILQQINEEQKVTVLIILHDLPIAKAYSKQVLLLKEGNLLQFGDENAVLTEENIRKCFNLSDVYDISKAGFITKKR